MATKHQIHGRDKASVMIEKAKKPYGQTEIRITGAVEKLVNATME